MKEFNGRVTTGSTGSWVSVKEYAELTGKSRQAVLKAIKNGKLQTREVPGRNQHGVSYEVYAEATTDNRQPEATTDNRQPEATTDNRQPEATTDNRQPEATTDNRQPEATTDKDLDSSLRRNAGGVEIGDQAMDEMDGMDSMGEMDGDSAAFPGLVGDGLDSRLRGNDGKGCKPSFSAGTASCSTGKVIEYVPYHKMDEAQLYALLLQEIDRRVRGAASKTAEWAAITQEYNQGELVPELKKLKGHRSERGLRHWYQKWQESDQDMFQLVHKNNAQVRGRKVTQFEQDYLLYLLLRDSKISIGSAITDLKDEVRESGWTSPSSVATLKRWCNDWAAAHQAVWGQARLGDKWVHDNIVPSILRDMSDIKFGDVLIADGHIISNDIINPATGKPARLTLIMFYDWASRYPVGASLAYTEDSVHILTALRNAILQLGFIPRAVYLDNGRAFKSKLFHERADEHDLEKELAGILPRLGIYAHFATPYNGRSKNIERFFKTMQEEWERFMRSFRGASIADKPAHLGRNEKWAKKMFEGKPMGYDEALTMAYDWVRNKYGNRPHSGLKGMSPYQVFEESERPADREINVRELDILMLKAERTKVRKDGIVLMGNKYWDNAMIDYVLQPVVIRYDYCDLNSILVYDMRSHLICEAELKESVHGFAVLSDNPLAYHQVKAKIKEQKQMTGLIQKVAKMTMQRSKDGVERELAKHQDIIDQRHAEIEKHNPLFKNPPTMKPKNAKRVDVNEEVAELERIASGAGESPCTESQSHRDAEESGKPEKVILLEDLLKEDEGELAETVSFSEMQKIIGIKR